MKKTICITPVDKTMEGWARAVKLLNDYKLQGFLTRSEFVEIVMLNKQSNIEDYKLVPQLQNFWQMRDRTEELLNDLEAILEIIKSKES